LSTNAQTIKQIKEELRLSRDRENNLKQIMMNHTKLEDRMTDGDICAAFLINQVK
jgi:hypothetical protein